MMGAERVVVTGTGGILGSAFARRYLTADAFLALGRNDLAGDKLATLPETLAQFCPTLVINCAADTNVEGAEDNRLRVLAANTVLPGILAHASRTAGARFVHFSSTGCYGRWKDAPYNDFDRLQPTTVHHTSKALGEDAVREAGAESLILRLGWVFGGSSTQRDFVRARIAEAAGKSELHSDPSQKGNPTFCEDVVKQVDRLIEVGLTGTFNCVGGDATTRFDYVAAILRVAGLTTRLVPGQFPRRAPVSPNEAAVAEKLDLLGLNIMRPWQDALSEFAGGIA